MNAYKTFIMMFYSLDAVYDETPNTELGNYLSSLNPFLFKGEGSADPAEYTEFKLEFSKTFNSDNIPPWKAYRFCEEYLKKAAPQEAIKAFHKITIEEWNNALDEM